MEMSYSSLNRYMYHTPECVSWMEPVDFYMLWHVGFFTECFALTHCKACTFLQHPSMHNGRYIVLQLWSFRMSPQHTCAVNTKAPAVQRTNIMHHSVLLCQKYCKCAYLYFMECCKPESKITWSNTLHIVNGPCPLKRSKLWSGYRWNPEVG